VKTLRARFLNLQFWLRPASVTALVAVSLIAVLILLNVRSPAPFVTAADLLHRSILAEEALAGNRDQILHGRLILKNESQAESWSRAPG